MKKLTENQQLILDSLRRSAGAWSPGCGWTWENRSTTMRYLDSLVKKGLVVKTRTEQYRERYEITEDGIKAAPTTMEQVRKLAGLAQ